MGAVHVSLATMGQVTVLHVTPFTVIHRTITTVAAFLIALASVFWGFHGRILL